MKIAIGVLKFFLVGGVILYLIALLAIIIFQEKMIFMPGTLPKDYQYEFPTALEEINLDANDGSILNALHFKVKNPLGVVLYYHGNAGELSSWGEVVQEFVNRKYDVLVMDYRGYGKSTGPLSERALYSDAQMFYDYLLKSYSEKDVVVYGRSLGTTFASYVAAKNNPRKLILEAPFYSLEEAASNRFPIFPVSWFLKYNFPTYQFIPKVKCPIVIVHGTADEMIGYDNSVRLSELAKPEQLRFIPISGGGHNDLESTSEYNKALDDNL